MRGFFMEAGMRESEAGREIYSRKEASAKLYVDMLEAVCAWVRDTGIDLSVSGTTEAIADFVNTVMGLEV
jgi:hypothetical protein